MATTWGEASRRERPPREGIEAAEKALQKVQPQGHWPDVARIAVEAAWPYAEGLIGNMRTRNFRQREANARMQRQVEDLKASARDQGAKLRDAQALIRQYEVMIADQGSGAATQHHWKAAASRLMHEKHELRAQVERLLVFRQEVSAALPLIWQTADQHADCFRQISLALTALDQPTAQAERAAKPPDPPEECPRCGQPDMLTGYPSSGTWQCANCGWQS